MLGNPKWFKRRKYGGWGLFPTTWQGWVYLAVMIVPFAVFQPLPYWDDATRTGVTIGWLIFLLLDVTHIMISLNKDERENKIEAMAERNAAWVMVLCITVGVLYQTFESALRQTFEVDWFLIVALFGGVIAKMLSNIIYERRSL
jgi:hypothetical protein